MGNANYGQAGPVGGYPNQQQQQPYYTYQGGYQNQPNYNGVLPQQGGGGLFSQQGPFAAQNGNQRCMMFVAIGVCALIVIGFIYMFSKRMNARNYSYY